jgi:hypothetical protein
MDSQRKKEMTLRTPLFLSFTLPAFLAGRSTGMCLRELPCGFHDFSLSCAACILEMTRSRLEASRDPDIGQVDRSLLQIACFVCRVQGKTRKRNASNVD